MAPRAWGMKRIEVNAFKVAALAAVLSGCSTPPRARRSIAAEPASSVLPSVTAEEMRSWDCENYLDLYHPSLFGKEAIRRLDLSKFSVSTAIDGFPETYRLSLGDLVSGAGGLGDRFVDYPWLADLALFPKAREAVYAAVVSKKLSGDVAGFLDRLAKDFEASGKASWSEAAARIEARAKNLEDLKVRDETTDATLLALCGLHVPLGQTLDCVRSIKQVLGDMLPQDPKLYAGAPVTLIPEFREYLSDPRNFPVLLGINRDLLELVRSGNPAKTEDLFSLIERNYRKAGFPPAEAYDRAWTFMGLYSTSGGNIDQRIGAMLEWSALNDEYRIGPCFAHFATAVSVLDARNYFSGKAFFSMPKNLQNTVNNGKVYHFWMSAYLARKNVLLGRGEKAASAAAWLAQLGYQMRSATAGRLPERAFYGNAFGPANNKIRLDLAYAANGSIFGARSAKGIARDSYSIDETLRALLSSGENLPPLTREKAETLVRSNGIEFWNRWNRIFAPKAALGSIR